MKGKILYACVAAMALGAAASLVAHADSCAKSKKACGATPKAKACCPATSAAQTAAIDSAALKELVGSGKKVTILDARTGKYDDGRRIPGAQSLAPTATAEEAAAKIPSKDSQVITYCTSTKCKASASLAAQLRKLGYSNVAEYHQGIEGWAGEGNEVVSQARDKNS